jgi:hypothetical protein
MIKRLAHGPSNTDSPAKPSGRAWARPAVLVCVTAWTLFVGLALWWLLNSNPGRTLWIVHDADPLQPASAERFHGWFKADFGVQRIYPWVLLGPYIALVALYFPLERGRLRLSLPLNLLTCAAFVAASQAISARTRATVTNVTIIKSDQAQGNREKSTVQVRISGLSDFKAGTRVESKSLDAADAGLTNLFDRLPPGLRPQAPPPWPRAHSGPAF